MLPSTTDATIASPRSGEEPLEGFAADALDASVSEPRGDDEARFSKLTSTLQEELAAFREGEENRITRLEKAIKELKPTPINVDPTANFWTVYNKVADEHDNDLLKKYAGDLDTSLLFAGLFSAVATTFIAQILPSPQSDTSGPSVVKARSILFASLAVTLFVAFIAVLGKQWILHYTRASTWGSIVDRGKERQVKFVGLKKWGLHYIMESLPVLLQIALLLFNIGLIVYLWHLDPSSAQVILAVTCIGFAFYTCIAVVATVSSDCPFQTPLSVLILKALPWVQEIIAFVRAWPGQKYTALLPQTGRVEGHDYLMVPVEQSHKTSFDEGTTPDQVVGNPHHDEYYMKLSNPTFWKQEPLFTSPLLMDTAASAGFWLLENSTDFSAATAVAAVFSEFQWPSHHHSTTALIRLRDTYTERFRAPEFDKLARIQALQAAAAYYVLYHAWLIWNTSQCCEIEVEKLPPGLPLDLLLLHKDSEEWHGHDLFEYLLRIEDRSEPVTSARFLSYIAPYWFCGDSDSAIRFRASRLHTLDELISVLKKSNALDSATLTNCVLCVGAAMDFPLHPEDLIRVDKSDYLALTFKTVVEHIHKTILTRGRRYRHAAAALKALLTLAERTTLPLVDAAWINGLLKLAAMNSMADEEFVLFLRLSARRTEECAMFAAGMGDSPTQCFEADPQSFGTTATSEALTPDDTLFSKVMKTIQTCDAKDKAVYGGLIAIRDIRRLEPSLFDASALQTLHDAMNRGNPFPVRQAAYDVMLVTRDQWLKSEKLRKGLEDLDFFKQLYCVVFEMARPDYQRSFLMMMGMLSDDEYWHSYLREAMDIWLPLRREGTSHILHIIANVGGLSLTRWDSSSSSSLDDYIQKIMVGEWAAVPGRPVHDLTADRLKPLVEVTEQFKELLPDNGYRRAVLAKVEQVIPLLERRHDNGYGGPGDDVRRIIKDLLVTLRLPPKRRSTYD